MLRPEVTEKKSSQLTRSPSPKAPEIKISVEVQEATQEFAPTEKPLLSTQYGWEELQYEKTAESVESEKPKEATRRRAFNRNQNQSLNQFQTLTAITKQKKKMGDGNFKQRLLSNTALKQLKMDDQATTPRKRFQNAVRRVVNEIRFTKLFGHVKKTELEKIARNANHALFLNRKEQSQKVDIEMMLKLEIKETALRVLEKTESAYKKIFWNRIYPSDEFKEFVREVTEKKNQYRTELNTQAVETKEYTGAFGRRKTRVTAFGHDDDEEDFTADSYLSEEFTQDSKKKKGAFNLFASNSRK
ncbi:Oidioi.mRNA.OKI2018_I69.PAR.g12984.t1.cds [Oikopleura dioica]|uniref:Oidioi.mRNA.OKI2018_I69.PAR.g12984.t1.cds n=1 Tax=Oikopleura dioica TaxID=34765 RepID=A0ABN7S2M2_OIKDI|nr:Oidioi.mRNA.OKI2018_I69.PAR.g12984.t1.cds [Oikopleura dioica]